MSYCEVSIKPATSGFGEYQLGEHGYDWPTLEDLLRKIAYNGLAVFELGKDDLPEGLEDILGRIQGGGGLRVWGYFEDQGWAKFARYFGIEKV